MGSWTLSSFAGVWGGYRVVVGNGCVARTTETQRNNVVIKANRSRGGPLVGPTPMPDDVRGRAT